MTERLSDQRIAVHLLEFPVPVAAQARQHFEELMREFELIQAGAADGDAPEVPRRLREMVHALTTRFASVSDEPRERVEDAIDRGDQVIDDHVMLLPPEAGPATQGLAAMLDEADEFCRNGQHLLTLATPAELVTYRRWYLGQVIAQVGGAAPTPWPQYRAEASGA